MKTAARSRARGLLAELLVCVRGAGPGKRGTEGHGLPPKGPGPSPGIRVCHCDGGSGRSPARACSSADTEGSALATRTCRPEPGVERSRLTAAPACGRGSGPSGEPHLESPGPAGSETLSHPDGDSESQTRLETRINRQSDLPRHPSRNYFPAVRLGRTNLTQIRAAAAAWPGLQ